LGYFDQVIGNEIAVRNEGAVFVVVDLGGVLLFVPKFVQGHLVFGQSPRFVGANHIGASHGFAGVQFPHQVGVLHHFFDGKS
jgi:hypothetical protein